MKSNAAFSMLELMISVAIIADIAVIAVPSFLRSREFAQDTRFASDLRTAVDAFEMYAAENNGYPPNSPTATVPQGMDQYLRAMSWSAGNSIGGEWAWDSNRNGSIAAVCVQFSFTPDELRMLRIDERIDNGILTTGAFRKISDTRYGYIIE
jgi:prepilin-type N-terminal cleavage/methylation domain-containing protein